MLAAFDVFRELSLTAIVARFLLATVCSALIGYERGKNRHAAGLRTHIVVCVAAAAVMILNQYLLDVFNSSSDPARLGAQVISGIGFLGAGSIVITGQQRAQHIKGLTTAAGLWASACMGLVIGSGFFEAAILMCVLLFTVIATLNRIDEKYLKDSNVMRFYIEFSSEVRFSSILSIVRDSGWHLTNFDAINTGADVNSMFIEVQRNGFDPNLGRLLDLLRRIDGVTFVKDT